MSFEKKCNTLDKRDLRIYPLVNDHIAGWNIPSFNRVHTSSIRIHFPLLCQFTGVYQQLLAGADCDEPMSQ